MSKTLFITPMVTNDQKSIDELRENVPAFINPSFDKIFKLLGKDKISGFTLWKDSTIEIAIKSLYMKKENADVSHTLIWKRTYAKNTEPDYFYGDTMIAPQWTYQIIVNEHPE